MGLPGYHADASLYRTTQHYAGRADAHGWGGSEVVAAAQPASPQQLACLEACVAQALTIRGTGTVLQATDFWLIFRRCAPFCGVVYSAQLVRQFLIYIRGLPIVPGAGGGGAVPPTAAGAGGAAAGTTGAVALAALAVAWLIARLIHLPFAESPLPPDVDPSDDLAPPEEGQAPPVPCDRMLTSYPQHVVGFGITGFLESGCAVADREAYAKAADYCNRTFAGECAAGACAAGGPCRPDYVPLELRRESAAWILYLACNSHLAFHCRCRC
jgi:hypothetical protein